MEELQNASLQRLDQWLARSWATVPVEYQWLLLQTLATTASRRAWIMTWPDTMGGTILDWGAGPGIISQEIALLKHCFVVGSDVDPNVLELAQAVSHLFNMERHVRFKKSDILNEPAVEPADGIVSRFVTQYLPDLTQFFKQAQRHLKPGGFLALEDIDDGYLIEHPQPPETWQSAVRAFQRHQAGPGGDRFVGRKLAQAGVESGLELLSAAVNPSVYAGEMNAQDLSVQFDIDRINRALPEMIRQGLITESEWYRAQQDYRASFPTFSYVSSSTVRLLFRRP